MKDHSNPSARTEAEQRRRFLRLFGTAAALVPLSMIAGCAEEEPPATPARAPEPDSAAPQQPARQRQAPEPERSVEETGQQAVDTAAEDMPRVSLDDPTAQALGYRHDASNVDPQEYPQRGANHVCRNCTLYQAGSDAQWGPCTLFPGKLVNADGWCSGYTPKPA